MCTNSHHDIADLINQWMVKNSKTYILKKEHNFSMKQKNY